MHNDAYRKGKGIHVFPNASDYIHIFDNASACVIACVCMHTGVCVDTSKHVGILYMRGRYVMVRMHVGRWWLEPNPHKLQTPKQPVAGWADAAPSAFQSAVRCVGSFAVGTYIAE